MKNKVEQAAADAEMVLWHNWVRDEAGTMVLKLDGCEWRVYSDGTVDFIKETFYD